jgi:hypothetical protein
MSADAGDQNALRPPRGRLVRLGVIVPARPDEASRLARLADAVGVDVIWTANEASAAALASAVGRAAVVVLPGADEPWARTAPVSVGRTSAEAHARADLDPEFPDAGVVREIGLFGTLDDCQRRLAQWVAAGITDLRAIVPDTPDVADVLAQLTAVVIGDPATHRPDVPATPPPPPPPWAAPRGFEGR